MILKEPFFSRPSSFAYIPLPILHNFSLSLPSFPAFSLVTMERLFFLLFGRGAGGGGGCRGDSSGLTLLRRKQVFLTSMGQWEGWRVVWDRKRHRPQTSPLSIRSVPHCSSLVSYSRPPPAATAGSTLTCITSEMHIAFAPTHAQSQQIALGIVEKVKINYVYVASGITGSRIFSMIHTAALCAHRPLVS